VPFFTLTSMRVLGLLRNSIPARSRGGLFILEVNVRNIARIKLGYYPLPPEEGKRLRRLLDFSAGIASVVDPCVGTGAALHQLTEGAEAEKHGVELDANRAGGAVASGIATIHGDLFNAVAKVESFSFLYLNPPYDSEIGSMDNKRMEFLFLEHTYRWLVESGVLLMVVPQSRLESSIPLLAENFTDLRVFRLTDPESERFDQAALLGVRKKSAARTTPGTVQRCTRWYGDAICRRYRAMRRPIACRLHRLRSSSIADCLSTRSRTLSSTRLPGNK
jgi:hypothetical protein